jgi:hypothetical protein
LIGGAYISVTMSDESFRGSFPGFLSWLVASTGKGVSGSALLSGALVGAFWGWVADRHSGRTFSAAPG